MVTSQSSPEPSRPNRYDPFLGDRELRLTFRALMEGAWTRLDEFMETDDRAWLFTDAILSPVVDTEMITVERWVNSANSPHARVMLAGLFLRDAAAARTAQQGDVDHEELARRAETILREVIRERPAMAEPWVRLLVSGRLLGVKLEELRQRFDDAHSRDPFRPDACREYLQCLTEKWGGSQTAVFDFARWLEIEAPPDCPSREALPAAHIEQGLLTTAERPLHDYLKTEAVVEELGNGLIKALNAIPTHTPTRHLGLFNNYALALHVVDARTARLVEDVFDRIDNRPTAYPWNLYREGISPVFRSIQTERRREADRY